MGQNLVIMRDLKEVRIVETLRHKRSPFVTDNVAASAPTTCAACCQCLGEALAD